MKRGKALLRTTDLAIGYAAGNGRLTGRAPRIIARELTLEIQPGRLVCLLGPNGSGKSTLLRTLAGLQPSLQGTVIILGTDIRKITPGSLAKSISLVLTDPVRHSHLTVDALVSLGRYPYSGWLGSLGEGDRTVIAEAKAAAGVANFSNRKISMLSDGESQKVMLARALAQDTPLLMLDEPTAHLDLPSRIQLLKLLHRLSREMDKGILLSTHDLDLALQVADEVWLMQAGLPLQKGAPEDLVLDGTFEAAFDKEGVLFDRRTGSFRMHQEVRGRIRLLGGGLEGRGSGAGSRAGSERGSGGGSSAAGLGRGSEAGDPEGAGPADFWTRRALLRMGFTVISSGSGGSAWSGGSDWSGESPESVDLAESAASVRIVEGEGRTRWMLENGGQVGEHATLASLLDALKEFVLD
jgi:iron complex transport system ATP-binding protein